MTKGFDILTKSKPLTLLIGDVMKHIDKEYCLPFDNENPEFWMRIEHLGRYLYAADLIKKHKPKKVLDAACSNGYGCLEMSGFNCEVVGLDYNEELIAMAKEAAASKQKTNVVFQLTDLNNDDLSWLEDIDLVTCFDTLEHLKNPKEFLSNISRALRKNGMLLLSVPKAKYEPVDKEGVPTNEFHLHRFTTDNLSCLLTDAGFFIQKTLYQPYTNMCMSLEKNVVRDTDIDIEQARQYFSTTEDALRFFARMFAIPDPSLEKFSYTYFIIARKR